MIIDFHTHCFDDSLAKSAVPLLEKKARIHAMHDGTVSGLKQSMAACGIDKSVALPVATKPSQVPAINEWAKRNRDKDVYFFGALHPDDKNFFDAAKQLKNDGFRGVKLHPDYQHFYADEKRMMPLYEALRDLNLLVVLHSGVDIGYPWPVYCTPHMIKNIVESVKGIRLVAAHMGAHGLWRDVEDLILGLPIFIDTAYSQYLLENSGMERMIKKHGAERVLFGTDSPWRNQQEEAQAIASLNLPSGDIDHILYKNALLLLQ